MKNTNFTFKLNKFTLAFAVLLSGGGVSTGPVGDAVTVDSDFNILARGGVKTGPFNTYSDSLDCELNISTLDVIARGGVKTNDVADFESHILIAKSGGLVTEGSEGGTRTT